mgnify:CR=1 FL=1
MFSDLLKKAREKHQITSVEQKEETKVNIPIEEEVITEEKQETPPMLLGDAIIKQSLAAAKWGKKLRSPSGAARRVAKAIASGNIKMSQLNKAFTIQKKYNEKRVDWHIVGSYALQELQDKLSKGMPLHAALNSHYERNLHE